MDLNTLQFRQELHDRYFHDDIYKLGRHRRLEHLTLHHVKYTAQLMETIHNINDIPAAEWEAKVSFIYRRCLDGMLVSISMLNTMNIHLHSVWGPVFNRTWGLQNCTHEGVYATGRIAKMIEDIDHMVIDNVANVLRKEVATLIQVYEHLLWSIGDKFRTDDPEQTVINAILTRMLGLEDGKFMADRHHEEIARHMKDRTERLAQWTS